LYGLACCIEAAHAQSVCKNYSAGSVQTLAGDAELFGFDLGLG